MFDKNYLGHNLIKLLKYYDDRDFVCTHCGIEIYYNYYEQYCVLTNGTSNNICEINCNEFIIKNIIE